VSSWVVAEPVAVAAAGETGDVAAPCDPITTAIVVAAPKMPIEIERRTRRQTVDDVAGRSRGGQEGVAK
jgi:hypothetical protein